MNQLFYPLGKFTYSNKIINIKIVKSVHEQHIINLKSSHQPGYQTNTMNIGSGTNLNPGESY